MTNESERSFGDEVSQCFDETPVMEQSWIRNPEMSMEDIMGLRQDSTSHIDPKAKNLRPNLSFSGCGFNGLYHVGVCAALQDFATHLYEDNLISGTSAGSLAATFLLCNLSMRKCAEAMMDLISSCKRDGMMFSKFNLNSYLKTWLNDILPDDAHITCSGKLHISLTKVITKPLYKFENLIVSEFANKDELVTAIMCSSFIPMVSGFYFPEFQGQSVMDGGFSNNLIEINDATITVTPFMAEADICPLGPSVPQGVFDIYNTRLKLSFFNLERLANLIFPNSAKRMSNLLEMGYNDCVRYLLLRKLIFCPEHAKIFVETGENSCDSCKECQDLSNYAVQSSVPSYLKEMIFEKEPKTYSYWGCVMDNRITDTVFILSELCSNYTQLRYEELCRNMDIIRRLNDYPFVKMALKPVEIYFGILRNIWVIIKPKNDTEAKNITNVKLKSLDVDVVKPDKEPLMNSTPMFFIPEDDLESPIEKMSDIISNDIETPSIASAIEISDSGIEFDFSYADSIGEMISFEKMREEQEISHYSKLIHIAIENEGYVMPDILVDVDSNALDGEITPALD